MAISVNQTSNLPAMLPENIVLHLQDAQYLINRSLVEQALFQIVPEAFRDPESDDAKKPENSFMRVALKAFIRSQLPAVLKKMHGDDWAQHAPPPRTDVLAWVCQRIIGDLVAKLSSTEWRMHVSSTDTQNAYHVLGLLAEPAAADQAPDAAGSP
jgi:hypothetical protein